MSSILETTVIRKVEAQQAYGATLMKIAESYDYVHGAEKASAVAAAFRENPSIHVVGVMTGEVFTKVLDRESFFGSLGRAYGWDILAKESISEFAVEVRTFHQHENIFTVAEALRNELNTERESYFGIIDEAGGFKGIFSTKSLLLYLSSLSQKDMEMAGTLQDRLVSPRLVVEEEGFTFRAYSKAAKGVGGDFYFQKRIGQRRHFVAIGDVSGKGAAASIVTSLLWGMFRMFDFRRGLKALLVEINEAIVQTFHLERHLTGIFMVWDFIGMNVAIADMGHGMAFLIRAGRFKRLDYPAVNFPLGIEQGMVPRIFRCPIVKGDIFCAYTDGLIEQRNADGLELGAETLTELVAIETASPDSMLDTVSRVLDRFRAHMPQTDDATWIQIEVR